MFTQWCEGPIDFLKVFPSSYRCNQLHPTSLVWNVNHQDSCNSFIAWKTLLSLSHTTGFKLDLICWGWFAMNLQTIWQGATPQPSWPINQLTPVPGNPVQNNPRCSKWWLLSPTTLPKRAMLSCRCQNLSCILGKLDVMPSPIWRKILFRGFLPDECWSTAGDRWWWSCDDDTSDRHENSFSLLDSDGFVSNSRPCPQKGL